MIALLGAVREEIMPVVRATAARRIERADSMCIFEGEYAKKRVLVAMGGMGRQKIEAASGYLCDYFRPSLLLAFGFAGGLSEKSKVGDLYVQTDILRGDVITGKISGGESRRTDYQMYMSALEKVESKGISHRLAAGLTVDTLVRSPGGKKMLYESSRAETVDMESFWVAGAAAKAGIPFLSVRAITDAAAEALPPFEDFVQSDGGARFVPLVKTLASHPRMLFELARFSAHLKSARRSLAGFLTGFLEAL